MAATLSAASTPYLAVVWTVFFISWTSSYVVVQAFQPYTGNSAFHGHTWNSKANKLDRPNHCMLKNRRNGDSFIRASFLDKEEENMRIQPLLGYPEGISYGSSQLPTTTGSVPSRPTMRRYFSPSRNEPSVKEIQGDTRIFLDTADINCYRCS
jgi:hypothetical protein